MNEASCIKPPESPVSAALAGVGAELACMEKSLARLGQRLGPLLLDAGPQTPERECRDESPGAPQLVQALENVRQKIHGQRGELDRLLDRLAV